jgi:peptidoglycan biosynthesis protein MviN/MurJ (putative lipid II flippase)
VEGTSTPPRAAEPTAAGGGGQGSGSMASSSLWAAVSLVATLGVQGLAALVILVLFGKGTDTDAVFAAYGVYGVIVLMCQSLRLTVVARLMESGTPWSAFDRFLGAGLSLVLIAIVLQLVLGGPISDVLTGDLGTDAQNTARDTLDILCIAITGQLVAALGAAVLAMYDEFRYPGLVYVAGGLTAIVLLLVLQGPIGILAAPIGVAAGSALSAVLMLWRLWRHGYRPQIRELVAGGRHVRLALMLLVGSIAPLLGQLNFVISLTFAAHIGPGEVTLYTGAFFAGAVVVAVTGSAAGLVLAGPVAQTFDGDAPALLPHLRTIMRAGLIVIGPAVAVAALIGDDLVQALLGASFSAADADRLIAAFVALSGLFVAQLALPLPLLAAFALSRYGAVAALAAVGTAVHVVLCFVALSLGSIVWLGVAASLSSLTTTSLMLCLIHRGHVLDALWIVVRETIVVGVVTVAAFGPPAVVAALLGAGLWELVAAVVGLAVFAVALRTVLPQHASVALRMVAPVLPAGRRAAPA